ncbi:dihydrolipoyl dehydrogenase [bacterium]|nr:dihydrolipoyl dehydrogenase [bacterium]
MTNQFDLVVIGGGPGGYVAAVRGAQLGLNVAVIEQRATLGGTCLNVGCIPSKALLDSTELFHQAKTKFSVHGIDISEPKANWKQMLQRKRDVVATTTKGIDFLMQKNKITRFVGKGTIQSPTTVSVANNGETSLVTGGKILIATGSTVTPISTVPFDGKRIISSDEALELPEIPTTMIIIGGGVIGVEMGSIYARLGTKVTIVETMDGLIPTMDRELGRALEKSLRHLDMVFHFGTKVTSAISGDTVVTVSAEDKRGELVTLTADYVLVAVGRRPNTDGLGLDGLGIPVDSRGRIEINDHYQTSVPSIYAIGDVVRGIMLAHKASEEGVACVEQMVGQKSHVNYDAIPGVVYTWPEVASVGKTEDELKQAGIPFKKGNAPFKASGRARAAEESDGFIKVLAHKETDEILGIHMIGPRVADLIAEAVVAVEYRASAEDIGIMSHPHPTFSETLKEAALAASGNRAIHF